MPGLEDILSAHPELEVGAADGGHLAAPESRLIDWIKKERNAAKPHVEKFRDAARQAYRFRDGHQYNDEDLKILNEQKRPSNAFNSAQKYIRFATGLEQAAPEALIFSAIDENDLTQQSLGEFATRSYDWALAKGGGIFERSRAFDDLIVTGMGWMDYWIDRGRDPRGLPAQTRISPLEMWWPDSDRQNLTGARWRGRDALIDKQEALARWPEHKILIEASSVEGDRRNRPEATGTVEFLIAQVATKPLSESQKSDPEEGKVSIYEVSWYEDQPGAYFYDPLEREDTWLSQKEFSTYRKRLRLILGNDVSDFTYQAKRVFQKIFLLNGEHQLGEILKLKDGFTTNCMTAHFDEDERTWYGFMRVLIDPQRYANKFFNQVIEIVGYQAKGGMLFEENAVKPKDVPGVEESFAKPGAWTMVSQGAISGKKLMPKPLPSLDEASMPLLQFCISAMNNVTGFDPDAFGMGAATTPGITLRQKNKSRLILLTQEFDSLSRFRIEEGEIILAQIKLLADGRLIRVGGPFDGTVMHLLQEPFATKYELNLDDTERDPNIRHEYSEAIIQLAPTLLRMNVFIPELLDYMLLPVKFREKLKQAIKAQAQAKQEAAEKGIQTSGRGSPVTPEERQAKVGKLKSDTMVQMARAERIQGQKKKDEIKTVVDAVVDMARLKLESDRAAQESQRAGAETKKAGVDTAQATLDLLQQSLSGYKPGPRPAPKAPGGKK
jgi:hypothetical protein